jgi:hypothetical protein
MRPEVISTTRTEPLNGMFWCRPKLQRTKRAGGGTFVPSATEDFRSFGALGTAHTAPVLQSSLLNQLLIPLAESTSCGRGGALQSEVARSCHSL